MSWFATNPSSEQCSSGFPLAFEEVLDFAESHVLGLRLALTPVTGAGGRPAWRLPHPSDPEMAYGLSAAVIFPPAGASTHCPRLNAFGRCGLKGDKPLACQAFPMQVPDRLQDVDAPAPAAAREHGDEALRRLHTRLCRMADDNAALADFVIERLCGSTGLAPDPLQFSRGAELGGMEVVESIAGLTLFLVTERGMDVALAAAALQKQARLAHEALNGWNADPQHLEAVIEQCMEGAGILGRMQAMQQTVRKLASS